MENRQAARYSISDYLKKKYKDIYIEIIKDGTIRADVIDINLNGVGFEIEHIESSHFTKLEESDDFFIKIYAAGEVLFAEVRKMWSALLGEEERIFKGGFMFSVISPKDRLCLSKFLLKIRDRV